MWHPWQQLIARIEHGAEEYHLCRLAHQGHEPVPEVGDVVALLETARKCVPPGMRGWLSCGGHCLSSFCVCVCLLRAGERGRGVSLTHTRTHTRTRTHTSHDCSRTCSRLTSASTSGISLRASQGEILRAEANFGCEVAPCRHA